MFKVKQLAWMMGCVSVMSGCTWYQNRDRDKVAFSLRPVMEVRHTASSDAMYQLGRYYQGKANYAEAIAAYEQALGSNPNHAGAHNGMGVAYSLQGRHELALQHLRKATQLSPLASHLRNN